MTIRLTTFIAALFYLLTLAAIPASRKPVTVTNSDGTTLTLIMHGDETFHFCTTLDGIPAVRDAQGDWHLAPHRLDSLQNTWHARARQRNLSRLQQGALTKARGAARKSATAPQQQRGIVLLVDFAKLTMRNTHTREKFNTMFNQKGYNENHHIGSVHDYFYDQSYGQFDITFDIYGPIKADHDYAYYGSNNEDGDDIGAAALVAEACIKAGTDYDIDWSQYDWDGDGTVDQVFLLYAGYGENSTWFKDSNTIWPHEFTLAEAKRSYNDGPGAIKLGGCIIDTYAVSCELSGYSGSTLNGIGTACHEFSHSLGLPDFYGDTSFVGEGMDAWSIMAAGNYSGYSGNGECPYGFTAYERWTLGWLEPAKLASPATITDLPDLQDSPTAYIIQNDGNPDEFFLLENHQNRGWFQYVGQNVNCHGLIITHVDYDEEAWMKNEINAQSDHQHMAIVPADRSGSYLSSAVPFPGSRSVTAFTDENHSSLGARLFTPCTNGTRFLDKPVTDIEESTNGLISFRFMGGAPAPTGIHAPQTSTNSSALSGAAQRYTLQGTSLLHIAPGIVIERQNGQSRKILVR